MNICGLLGHNINYSKSPEIHNNYYRLRGIPLSYSIFDVSVYDFPTFIKKLKENKIIGFNVTIPYKETIFKYLSDVKAPADKIKAVNTVLVKEECLIGYNTDYFGFIKSLENIKFTINNCSALVIGTGGAAKAVSHALMDNNCRNLKIITRNTEKAKLYFSPYCEVLSLDNYYNLNQFDIIINCTPVGNINDPDSIPIDISTMRQDCLAYDLIYSPMKTKFLSVAESKGAAILNGEKMLKYQAYEAADIWIDYINNKKERKVK